MDQFRHTAKHMGASHQVHQSDFALIMTAQVFLNCSAGLYVCLDMLLAALLTFYLHRHRSEFNFKR